MSTLFVDTWAETVVLPADEPPRGDMPHAGDECRLCDNVFEHDESVFHPTSTSPDGHVHRGEWVCGEHVVVNGSAWRRLPADNPS